MFAVPPVQQVVDGLENQLDLLTSAARVGPELPLFSRSVGSDSVTPRTAAREASLSITNSRSVLKPMSIQPSHPLLSPSPPTFSLSQHQGLFQ